MSQTVDYWCNAFTPEREALWDASLRAQGVPLKVRTGRSDSFVSPDDMISRMDELGISTLVIPTSDLPPHARPTDYEPFANRFEESAELARRFPGRFAATWSIDPTQGMEGIGRAREALAEPWTLGLHLHTHSWDRPFDCADYYPYYALAAEFGVPVVVQAGTSGGLKPSACGQPIGIDRPAIYFPGVDFVLSHTGWPWVQEAIAMALKFPNVYLGTSAYPPRHWQPELVAFIAGAGRGKVLFGTSFPVVGHRHALGQLDELDLSADARAGLLGKNAHKAFARLTELTRNP